MKDWTEKLAKIRQRMTLSKRARLSVLFLAAAIMMVGLVWSVNAADLAWSEMNLAPLVALFLVLIPVTILLNGLEYWLSVRITGNHIHWLQACRIAVIASAANMLPLPGAAAVKVAHLKSLGTTVMSGTILSLLQALLWLSSSLVIAGFFVFSIGHDLSGTALVLAGATGTLVSVFGIVRKFGRRRLTILMTALRFSMVAMIGVRFWVCLLALGLEGSLPQAVILIIGTVFGAMVSIVPAGLGINEVLAALIATLISLAPETAFLVTSLNRITGLLVVVPLALILAKWKPAK